MQYGNPSTRVLTKRANTREHVYAFINRRHAFLMKKHVIGHYFRWKRLTVGSMRVNTPFDPYHAW